MDIIKVKNAISKQYTKIDDSWLENSMFKKATAKNVEKICQELEKYFAKQGIVCKFDYYFASKENGK